MFSSKNYLDRNNSQGEEYGQRRCKASPGNDRRLVINASSSKRGRFGSRDGYKPRQINLRVGTAGLAAPPGEGRQLVYRAVRPLPEKRKGLGLGHDGDVPERGVHKEGGLRSPKRYAARPF